jgi:CCR4-NOT transcription complex subunit 7/8
MKEMFFEDDIDDSKYCGHLYGLGTNFVVASNNSNSTSSKTLFYFEGINKVFF